jgi:hypothetical protein
MMRAEKRLYLTRDRSRVVEEGAADAAFLLAAQGAEIPDAEARRLGLMGTPEEQAAAKAKLSAGVAVPSTATEPVPEPEPEPEPEPPPEPVAASKARARGEDK